MHRVTVVFVLCIVVWASASFVKPAFCHAAEVREVAAIEVEGSTHLDITVWHNVESSLHYVDIIEVTWGDNVTSMAVDPKSLTADGTFTVDYNMGPVSGTATITVRARCSVTAYSGAISWSGTIQEPIATPTPSPSSVITPSPSPSPTGTPTPSPTGTATPNPTPTPSIPEFPLALLLPILMAAITVGALLYKKKAASAVF